MYDESRRIAWQALITITTPATCKWLMSLKLFVSLSLALAAYCLDIDGSKTRFRLEFVQNTEWFPASQSNSNKMFQTEPRQ